MRTSIKLRQERARVVESLRSVTERAEAENRNLNADERQTYDNHEESYRSLTERIERAEAEEERSLEESRSLGRGDDDGRADRGREQSPEERQQAQRAAFAQFLRRGQAGMNPEQRALVEDAVGEIIVPELLETEIVRELPKLSIMRALVDVRPINTNRVRRRSMDELTVGWGKLETKPAGELKNRESSLTPDPGAFTYVEDLYGLTKIGEDEFDDSDVNLEAYVRSSFAQGLAEAEDTGFCIGTGHANEQPVGLFTALGGVPTVPSVAGGAVEIDDFIKLIYALDPRYRTNASFLMSSGAELAISTKKDNDGQYLWQPSVQAGRPNTFKGYAINNQDDVAAPALNARFAGFGDWKRTYRIYDRQGMTVQRLNELYAEDGMVGFKVRRRVTGDVVRPQAARILQAPAA